MCLHLPERVLRRYRYVQAFLDLLATMFVALKPEDVVVAFQDYLLHVLSQADRGRQIAAD